MTVSAKLSTAIEIFTELGWTDADVSSAEHLPTGTAEQQHTARASLATGDWGEFGPVAERSFGWISWIDVDATMLALFAVRVGVDARRAAAIMPGNHRVSDDLAARILSQRGPVFCARFIEHACASSRRAWEHSTSVHAGAAVRLVAEHDLPVPGSLEYLKDWAVFALGALTGEGERFPAQRGWCDPSIIERRYAEHARTAVAVGVPATGPFAKTLAPAVARSWIHRHEAAELAFTALDAAGRPGDRKEWIRTLIEDLAVTDAELIERADALVGVLGFGDPPVVESVAPILIAGVDDRTLTDVLSVGLSVKTKKARRALLTAAAKRARPDKESLDVLGPLVAEIAADKDPALARAAAAVVTAWDVEQVDLEPEVIDVAGWWRPTPALWNVPRLDIGEVTVDSLTEAAARLVERPVGVVDVEVERFLALANGAARTDPAGTRDALRGVPRRWSPGLSGVAEWVRGEPIPLLDRPARDDDPGANRLVWGVCSARQGAVLQRLGAVPCLLSTPTWEDLRIDPADLVTRLTDYVADEAAAGEADLSLAITRIDLHLVTDAILDELDGLAVPVVSQSGDVVEPAAGSLIARYTADPFREPALTIHKNFRAWIPEPLMVPDSLAALPDRWTGAHSTGPEMAVFPTWGDGAVMQNQYSDSADTGLLLRQMARRSTPLSPGMAINLIGDQRGLHHAAAADGSAAVIEAWERGLLRPGVADIRYLDWRPKPTNLAAFARVCLELAEQGLASVVWSLLDDLIAASVATPRMLAGTADLVEAIELLLPGATDVNLPGVRALAKRRGSSRAVTMARAITAGLPDPTAEFQEKISRTADEPFEDVWPVDAGTGPVVEDGASITAEWVDSSAPTRFMAVDLTFPNPPHPRFRITKRWFYDLENEGQCRTSPYDGDTPSRRQGDEAWLHWDSNAQRLVVSEHRNRYENKPGPLPSMGDVPPLTTSMVAAVLAALCHDTDEIHDILSLIDEKKFGAGAVRIAIRSLLPHADISPARIVRLIEREPTTLPTLWPVLTESIRFAAEIERPPRWLNRVLDVALSFGPILREAEKRGLIRADWQGLTELADRRGSSAATRKARALLAEIS